MASGTSRPLLVLAAVGFLPCLIAFARIGDARTWWSIATSALVSFLGMRVTARIIPVLKASTLRAGLSGKDINKRGTEAGEKPIPESLGLAPGQPNWPYWSICAAQQADTCPPAVSLQRASCKQLCFSRVVRQDLPSALPALTLQGWTAMSIKERCEAFPKPL